MKKKEMMPSYLIQRGEINKYGKEYNEFALLDFVNLSYMGSAEYEFGAVYDASDHMINTYESLELFKTDIKHYDGRDLYIYCKPEIKDNVIATIEYEMDASNKRITKESTRINRVFNKNESLCKEDFWWDLEYNFMFFLGNNKTAESFKKSVANTVKYKREYLTLENQAEKNVFVENWNQKRDKNFENLRALDEQNNR